MSPSAQKQAQSQNQKMTTKTASPEKNGENLAEKVGAKRQRRPSVRLGEIGGYMSSDSNRRVGGKSNGKQVGKNGGAKKSGGEGSETLGRGKEGKKSLVANMKRIRSNLMNVEGSKVGKDGGEEFRVSSSESPVELSENLEVEKGKSVKRVRTDRVSVEDKEKEKEKENEKEKEKLSGEKDGEGEFRVSDSESSEREREIENGDQVGNGVRVLEEEENGNGNGNVNGVKEWLERMGLGKYGSVFDVHEVDEEVLPLLTLEDLKDMGINAVGSRRKIFAYIQKLRE